MLPPNGLGSSLFGVRVVASMVVMKCSSWLQTACLSQEMQASIQDLSLTELGSSPIKWMPGSTGYPSLVGYALTVVCQKAIPTSATVEALARPAGIYKEKGHRV